MSPSLTKIGPSLVHLLLEIHPLYYRGALGYNPDNQSKQAQVVYQMIEELFIPKDGESDSETFERAMQELAESFSDPKKREFLEILRPRMWWTNIKYDGTHILDAVETLSELDIQWRQGGQYKDVQNVLENLVFTLSTQGKKKIPAETLIEQDWRYVFLADRPLKAQAREAFLREIPGNSKEIWRSLFRPFREMPELGNDLVDILRSFPDPERKALVKMSPGFALYMSDISLDVWKECLANHSAEAIDKTFEEVKRKSFCPEMSEFWKEMPFEHQDELLKKQIKEIGIDRLRPGLPWVEIPSRLLSVDLLKNKIRGKLENNPKEFLDKNPSPDVQLAAVLINGKNLINIINSKSCPTTLPAEILEIACDAPSAESIKLMQLPKGMRTRDVSASGLLFVPDEMMFQNGQLTQNAEKLITKSIVRDPNNFIGVPCVARPSFINMALDKAEEGKYPLTKLMKEALIRTETDVPTLLRMFQIDASLLKMFDWDKSPVIKDNTAYLQNGDTSHVQELAKGLIEIWKGSKPVLSSIPKTILGKPFELSQDNIFAALKKEAANYLYIAESQRTSEVKQFAMKSASFGQTLKMLGLDQEHDMELWKIAVRKNPKNLLEIRDFLGDNPDRKLILETAIYHPEATAKLLRYSSVKDLFKSIHSAELYEQYMGRNPGKNENMPQDLKDWIKEFEEKRMEAEKRELEKTQTQVNVYGANANVVTGNHNTVNATIKEESKETTTTTTVTDNSNQQKGFFSKAYDLLIKSPAKTAVAVTVGVGVLFAANAYIMKNPDVASQDVRDAVSSGTQVVQKYLQNKTEAGPHLRVRDFANNYVEILSLIKENDHLKRIPESKRTVDQKTKISEFEAKINYMERERDALKKDLEDPVVGLELHAGLLKNSNVHISWKANEIMESLESKKPITIWIKGKTLEKILPKYPHALKPTDTSVGKMAMLSGPFN